MFPNLYWNMLNVQVPCNFLSAHKIVYFLLSDLNKLLKSKNNGKCGNLYSKVKCCTILCIHHTFLSRLKHSTFSSRKAWKEKSIPCFKWYLNAGYFWRTVASCNQLCCKQGHLLPRRQGGGSQPSEVSLVRRWPWSSKALTHLLCF